MTVFRIFLAIVGVFIVQAANFAFWLNVFTGRSVLFPLIGIMLGFAVFTFSCV